MDLASALWIVVPLAVIHVVGRRWRGFLPFQLILDVALLLLPGQVLVSGGHIGPGVPGGEAWGAPRHLGGSPEQTDLPLEFAVWFQEVRRLTAAGHPPWVSDRIGGGVPLFANGQTTLPFPPQLPVWILGPERGTDVTIVWRLEAAALGTFLLLRRFAVIPAAAAVGGLAYGLNLYLLSFIVVPAGGVAAAAPWALWALVGALRGRRRAAAFLALLLGALAGWQVHPETATFVWLAVGVIGLTLAWGRWRRLRRLLVAFGLALPVAALGVLPTLAHVAGSAKLAKMSVAPQYPMPGATWELRGRLTSLLLVPWRDGHPSDGTWQLPFASAAVAVSVGAVALTLVLAARPRRRFRRVALACVLTGGLAAALLWQLPGFAHLLARAPVIRLMNWSRDAFLVPLCLAILAALSCDAWLRQPRRRRLLLVAGVVQAVVLALALTAPQRSRGRIWKTALLPAATALTVPWLTPTGGWLLPLLVAGEQVGALWGLLPSSTDVWEESPVVLTALKERCERSSPPARVLGLGGALPPNLAARWGLADLRSHGPMRPLHLAQLHLALGAEGLDLAQPVTTPWAGLAGAWGVGWLATDARGISGAAAPGWEESFREGNARLYRNRRFLPVLRIANAARWPPGDPADGSWEVVDFASTAVTGEALELGGSGELTALESGPWRWRARVQANGAVLALLHVPVAPGWKATLNGRQVPVVRANIAAMGVIVPAGDHDVAWEYQPPGWRLGAGLTGAGLLGCALLAWGGRRKRG